MQFLKFFDSSTKFRSLSEVKAAIKKSKNYKNEPIDNAKSLNFFQTSKQKSYLIATEKMVYCVVDDIRKNEPKVNWSEKTSIFKNKVISTSSKMEKTGLVSFGDNHKNWLYTKSIFSGDIIENEVSKLISEI